MTDAIVPEAESDDAEGLEFGRQCFAHCAIDQPEGCIRIGKQEGQTEHGHFRNQRRGGALAVSGEVQGAGA
ncbi:hypothetical protein D3C72_2428770 [compost metagenome]